MSSAFVREQCMERTPSSPSSPVLGKGSFGQVELIREQHTGALQALKSVRRDAPKRGSVAPFERAKAEAVALTEIGPHPSIVKLLDSYETDDSFCMVLEACCVLVLYLSFLSTCAFLILSIVLPWW